MLKNIQLGDFVTGEASLCPHPDLDGLTCYTPRLCCWTSHCWATNLCSTLLCWMLQTAIRQGKCVCVCLHTKKYSRRNTLGHWIFFSFSISLWYHHIYMSLANMWSHHAWPYIIMICVSVATHLYLYLGINQWAWASSFWLWLLQEIRISGPLELLNAVHDSLTKYPPHDDHFWFNSYHQAPAEFTGNETADLQLLSCLPSPFMAANGWPGQDIGG